MQQEQEQNRTEEATPFKLSEARKRGQVAKSLDLNTFVMVAALLIGATIWGASQWREMGELCQQLLAGSAEYSLQTGSATAFLQLVAVRSLTVLMPFLALGVVAAILANLLQTGPILSADPIKPKFERINPIAGFKRVFNKRMLFEAFKSVVKLFFFGSIVYAFMLGALPGMLSLTAFDPDALSTWLADNSLTLLFRLGLGLLVVAILDIAYVRWQYRQQMMMSRREVKEEVKRREGDPQIRAKIRELQRENLKQARSIGKLPDADVLITNPTHFGVALRYDRETMDAPIVLAKGTDQWVDQMKAMARQHGVPILERRQLARTLFKHGVLDKPIPPNAFVDVARVYAELATAKQRNARYEVTA